MKILIPIFLCQNSYLSYEYNKTVVLLPVCGGRKILAVAGFLAGRDCQILQIETQKRNAFTLSFLSRRDLQILLVEPAKESKTAKFCRPTHTGNNRRILLTRTIQSFMRIGWFCSLFVDKKWRRF